MKQHKQNFMDIRLIQCELLSKIFRNM